MTKEIMVITLVRFFRDSFEEDPSFVADWCELNLVNIDELATMLDKLFPKQED